MNENERHFNQSNQSDVPEWALINELDLRSNRTHEEVMIIQAMLHGHPAKLLLDSGASGNFINESFVNRLKMVESNRNKLEIKDIEAKKIKLADGSIIESNQFASNVDTFINGKNIKNSFIILSRLNNKFDGILGMPFLTTVKN